VDGSVFRGRVSENCPTEGSLLREGKVYNVRYDGKTYLFSNDISPTTLEVC